MNSKLFGEVVHDTFGLDELPDYSKRAQKKLLICFTPRSGSSWLKDMLYQTGCLGYPGEFLNPNMVQENLRALGQCSPYDYLERVMNQTASENGIASIELTWFHLCWLAKSIAVSPFEGTLPEPFSDESFYVYLTRRDFVAQAVSMYRASESGHYHQVQPSAETTASAVGYDGNKIKFWCLHLLQQEYGFESWFSRKGFKALRFTYEDIVDSAEFVVKTIAGYVGIGKFDELTLSESHYKKLTPPAGDKLATQFNMENPEFVEYWSLHRGLKQARPV
jgi:LPS sulfotransferase NodH